MAVIPVARALHQVILITRAKAVVIVVMFIIVVMFVARAKTVAIYPAGRLVMQL